MEQATVPTAPAQQPTVPSADSFEHAHSVAGSIIAHLELRPFAVEIEEDFPVGWRVHLKYRAERGAGLYEAAAYLDAPVTRADTAFGVHLDTIARVHGIEVRGSALVSPQAAAALEGEPTPISTTPDATPQTSAAPAKAAAVPLLLASNAAQVPLINPVVPIFTEHLDQDDEARCARCGCTENAACEGGCYWVPNRQMIDLCSACATTEELQAMTYTAEISDGGE